MNQAGTKVKFKVILAFLCLSFSPLTAEAQHCEWIRSVDNVFDYVVHADDSGNIVTGGTITSNTSLGGTSLTGSSGQQMYLAKRRPDGTLIWVTQSVVTSTSGLVSCTLEDITSDDFANYYLTGSARGSHNFGNGVQINQATSQLCRFVIKYDSAGTALWVRQVRTSASSPGILAVVVDTNNQPIISMHFSDTLFISGSTTTLTALGGVTAMTDLALLKFTQNGALIYARQYGGTGRQSMFRSLAIDEQNRIYLSAVNFDTWTFAGKTLGNGHILLKFNGDGDPLNAGFYWGSSGGGTQVSVFPDGRVVMTGSFSTGTLYLDSTIFLVKTGNPGITSNSFVAMFDTSLKPIWAIKEYPSQYTITSFPQPAVIRNHNIYFGGRVQGDSTVFGGVTIPGYGGGKQTAVLVKIDTLGNLLWCFFSGCPSCNQTINDGTVDPGGDMYFTGNWSDTLSVFNKQEFDTSNISHGYTTKISDYAIKRGNVSSGPYCAGDSIFIPYTISGEYQSNNEFIAELSDSAGNFYQGVRELGRLRSDSAGTVVGVLPLFQVASSARYRIRIVSTYPVVQSYYLKDTLRLLIFSKDSADAGPDQLVCQGEKTYLSTTGGSKWQWSPTGYFVDPKDSAKVSGIVAPDTSTEFRIIISDSSGCGLTDTDYVFVRVRPPLEVQVPAVVKFCILRNAVVEAQGVGGDSANYHFKWWWDGDATKTVLSTTHILTISPFSTRRYWVKLTDSCSRLSDSALVTVSPESGVSLKEIPDTTLCYGQSIEIELSSQVCDSSAMVYSWNNGLGTGLNKTLSPLQTTDYQVVARDTVDGRTDTLHFRITVLPALDVSLGKDTLLCLGQNMVIHPSVSGGNSAYRYRWMMDTGTGYQYMDTTAGISLIADKNISYRLHVSDQCSAPSDSDEIEIKVRDELHMDITEDTLVCQGENVLLWSQTKGGDDSKHLISWYDEQLTLIDTGKTLPVKLSSSKGFMSVLMDNCTLNPDTAFVFVDVREGLSIGPISDFALCHGAEAIINPVLGGGLVPSYKLWLQKEGEAFIEITTPYRLKPDSSMFCTLVLKDGCSEDSAFVSFQIDVSEPLEAAIGVADSVCAGQALNLKALLKGGLPAFYDIDWFRNDTLLNMNTDEWFDFPQTTTKYVLVVGDGCSDKAYDSVQVVVLPEPRADFLVSDTMGCSPLSFTLSDNSFYHDPTRNVWKVAGQFYESENAEITLGKPGSYAISLRVYNELNCMDELTQQKRVVVHPKPVALFDVYPSARQTDEALLLIRKGTGANTYYWDIGDGNFIHTTKDTLPYTYTDSGYYSITHIAVNKEGCADTASYTMQVHLSPLCAIPNAFSVNGDRLNETFAPDCSGIRGYTMTIFNRWGQIMLECENCAWDGTFEGMAVPAGIYHYRIDYITHLGERAFAVGAVSVLR